MYLYESHLGGLYFEDEIFDDDMLYCDECGDSDMFMGDVGTWQEALNAIGYTHLNVDCNGGYQLDYVYDLLKEGFDDVPSYDEYDEYVRKNFKTALIADEKNACNACYSHMNTEMQQALSGEKTMHVPVYRHGKDICIARKNFAKEHPELVQKVKMY